MQVTNSTSTEREEPEDDSPSGCAEAAEDVNPWMLPWGGGDPPPPPPPWMAQAIALRAPIIREAHACLVDCWSNYYPPDRVLDMTACVLGCTAEEVARVLAETPTQEPI